MAKFFTKLIPETSVEVTEEYDGTVTITEAEPENLMSFTIDGTEYRAKDGATWLEWVNSEYNTAGYYCSSAYDHVGCTDDEILYIVKRSDRTTVVGNEYIIKGEAYTNYANGTVGGGSNE